VIFFVSLVYQLKIKTVEKLHESQKKIRLEISFCRKKLKTKNCLRQFKKLRFFQIRFQYVYRETDE